MSTNLRNSLRAALEDLEEGTLVESDSAQAELADALLETEQAAQEAEEADQVVDELETVEDSLTDVEATVESFIEEGGMTQQTARMHHVAMQNILRRLPINVDRYVPSTESFGGYSDKLTASQEALEGVKNVLKKIADAIKKAWQKLVAAVKGLVSKFKKGGQATNQVALTVKSDLDELRKTKKAVPADVKVNTGSAGEILSIGGKWGNPVKALDAIKKGFDEGVKGWHGQVARLVAPVASAAETASVSRIRDAFEKVNLDSLKVPEGEICGGRRFKLDLGGAKGVTGGHATGGNMARFKGAAWANKAKDSGTTIERMGRLKFTLVTEGAGAASEQQAMDINSMFNLNKSVSDIADLIESYENSTWRHAEQGINEVVKASEALAQKGPDAVEKGQYNGGGAAASAAELADLKTALNNLNKLAELFRGVGPQYVQFMLQANRAALEYMKRCIDAHK